MDQDQDNKTHKGEATLEIIREGLLLLPGSKILERRRYQKNDDDFLSKVRSCDLHEHVNMCTANSTYPVNWENGVNMIFLQRERGMSAQAEVNYFKNDHTVNEILLVKNIIKNCFSDRVLITTKSDSNYSSVPEVAESNQNVGMNEWVLYPQNPLLNGFILQ